MPKTPRKLLLTAIAVFAFSAVSRAASVSFTPKELFRIPFGNNREALGAKIEGGNLLIPRDFTLDSAGHFYIYDSNNHRIARYASDGTYEMGYGYSPSADHVFAHADSSQNLWLLISDPAQGLYYGVYDTHGKRLREGIFSQFNHYELHVDDNGTLQIILSSTRKNTTPQTFIFDEDSLLMKKENIARPPENHHQLRRSDHTYFIDQVPGGSSKDSPPVNRVTDESHHGVANIQGEVIYMTEQGDVYARVGTCEVNVYDVEGSFKGKVLLKGLSSACASIRFDAEGDIYELDGIPDENGRYTASMPGMRLMFWERR